jgi:hypothetical protein
MDQVIDEQHAGYIVTIDRDEEPQRPPPRILSRSELPTDAELSAVHAELETVLEGKS